MQNQLTSLNLANSKSITERGYVMLISVFSLCSCFASPDLIKVYDGSNPSDILISKLCGQAAFVEMLSSGDELLVEFSTKSHLSAKGFKAEFAFVPIVPHSQTNTASSSHPWWSWPVMPSSMQSKPWHGKCTLCRVEHLPF